MPMWWLALVGRSLQTRPPEEQEVKAFVDPRAFTSPAPPAPDTLQWSELTADDWADMDADEWDELEP
jgi:hypothetical protein